MRFCHNKQGVCMSNSKFIILSKKKERFLYTTHEIFSIHWTWTSKRKGFHCNHVCIIIVMGINFLFYVFLLLLLSLFRRNLMFYHSVKPCRSWPVTIKCKRFVYGRETWILNADKVIACWACTRSFSTYFSLFAGFTGMLNGLTLCHLCLFVYIRLCVCTWARKWNNIVPMEYIRAHSCIIITKKKPFPIFFLLDSFILEWTFPYFYYNLFIFTL